MAGMTTRVLLTDDDPLVRAGLALILGGSPDITVVGEAVNGRQAVDAVLAGGIDVVLMDIRMPVHGRHRRDRRRSSRCPMPPRSSC